ncbi:hypothetical protein QPK87_20930 [Kamptonema cortianum]|nr:hypothetical protein [Kamptonema cortianum]
MAQDSNPWLTDNRDRRVGWVEIRNLTQPWLLLGFANANPTDDSIVNQLQSYSMAREKRFPDRETLQSKPR